MIQFIEQNVKSPSLPKREVKNWIKKVIEGYGKSCGNVSIVFCDDEYILDINRQYLEHDYYTDIITFDYVEDDLISGDLIISLDTVKSNALQFDEDYSRELKRVVIHGILHLIGLDDHSDSDEKQMREAEDAALLIFPTL